MTTQIETGRIDSARQFVRKVIRNSRDKNKWRKVVKVRLWMPVALQILLIIGVVWYTNSRFPGFVNASNIANILLLAVPLAIVVIGQTHALLVGYLDLSVGAMISLGVVVASFWIPEGATTSQILSGVAAIFACGLALGLVNAALVRGVKIPSIIATLATLSILDGISLTLRPTPGGSIDSGFTSSLRGGIGPVPLAFILVVVGAGALDYWLHASGSGLQLRSVGFDERSARRSGVRTTWVRVRALVLSALFAALASYFVMARSGVGNAQIGSSYALNSITAAVLGGAALSGGRATFTGGVVASVLLAVIITVLPFLGLGPEFGLMIIGVLVLIGIILFQVGDLKELVKRNYRRARRVVLGSRPPAAAALPSPYPVGTDFSVIENGRKIIRGGIVLSLDPTVGDLTSGDILIEGDKIVAVSPSLNGVEAEQIDAVGDDRHARFRRLAPTHLGGHSPQHRHRRAARREDQLHLVRAAQPWLPPIGPRTPMPGTWSAPWVQSTPGSPPCSTGPTSRPRLPTPTPSSRP